MNKIALILPYFGKLPNYFNLWLNSAKNNESIDFFIFTDQRIENSFSNIHVYEYSIDKIINRLNSILRSKFVIGPYKLTDYKPAYGLIFEDYIKDYDFWGYCDCDLIFGQLRNFITEDILNSYDKIYTHGHLTLFKNTYDNNRLFLKNHNYDCYTFEEVCKTKYPCHFDEVGICEIAEKSGLKTYNGIQFADIDFQKNNFNMVFIQDQYTKQLWKWDEGKLYRVYVKNGEIVEQEMEYIHLQKRKMNIELKALDEVKAFLIVPNKFIDVEPLTCEKIGAFNKSEFYFERYIIRVKWWWKKLKWGVLKQKWLMWKKHRKYIRNI